MELSLRRRTTEEARAHPVLRVVETHRPVLHEEPDPGRVRRLCDALLRDGVLRNPPVAAEAPDGALIVLDGANRTSAARSLALPHLVVQVIAYDDPEVALSTWRHYVLEEAPGSLRQDLARLDDAGVAERCDPADAEDRVARRASAAAVIDRRGACALASRGLLADAEALRRVVALYRGTRCIHRVAGGDLDTLAEAYGPGALVCFPPFRKDELLDLAMRGSRLPTGISRHVIPGRALRLNTALEWLRADRSVEEKQQALDADIRERRQRHGVRYYAEPTFLFDE